MNLTCTRYTRSAWAKRLTVFHSDPDRVACRFIACIAALQPVLQLHDKDRRDGFYKFIPPYPGAGLLSPTLHTYRQFHPPSNLLNHAIAKIVTIAYGEALLTTYIE